MSLADVQVPWYPGWTDDFLVDDAGRVFTAEDETTCNSMVEDFHSWLVGHGHPPGGGTLPGSRSQAVVVRSLYATSPEFQRRFLDVEDKG